jgi:hypothetical protein
MPFRARVRAQEAMMRIKKAREAAAAEEYAADVRKQAERAAERCERLHLHLHLHSRLRVG